MESEEMSSDPGEVAVAVVEETEIVRESEELVEVHADVTVSTPAGDGENLDYFLLAPEGGEWRYLTFLPEVVRDDMSQEEIDQAMRRGNTSS